MRRRNYFRLTCFYLGIFVFAFTFTLFVKNTTEETTKAASTENFRPGNIISDYIMGNYTSMTEAEIQAFLTKKNSCNNKDYDYYVSLSSSVNATWHWDNGHFICLSEERFGDGEVIGSGDTAAHIIWQAAQDYHINPQVLIVLLQKETGLITDPIPNNYDYRKATGYGCPDGAPCSEKYYGFKNQIRNAASLFRTVLDGGWTNYPLGDNYIQYSPDVNCGGSVVKIENLATSSLYRYTPYQPNAGALAASYGTAPCGAYGNRNFYLYFMDYFGDPATDSMIGNRYNSIGGRSGFLGKNLSKEICGLINKGCYQQFEIGYIYWTEKTGAWEISGGIFDEWFKQGTEWGQLGYPTSGEQKDKNGTTYQDFEHGRIYWTAKNGAWIELAIQEK